MLGGVDEFEPVSGGGDVDHAEEGFGEMIVAGGDGSVDLEMAEHPLDAVALLVEGAVVLDLHAAVRPPRNDGLDVSLREVGANGIGIVPLVGQQRSRGAFREADQSVIRLAIGGFATRQVERERSSEGIGQAVKLTGEPAPRAAKSASLSPPLWMARPLDQPLSSHDSGSFEKERRSWTYRCSGLILARTAAAWSA